MTFQAYLDTIKEKTGKTPQDFIALAEPKGFLKPDAKVADILAWLKADFDLGRGHGMAIINVFKSVTHPERRKTDERIDKLFTGKKAAWREHYDALLAKLQQFGGDVRVAATDSYVSLLKGDAKFGVVYVTADRMDIGIKRKGEPFGRRFEEAGAWNSMVTHRARISKPDEIDAEILTWLRAAYDKA
jgi:hypothetical protein